MVQFAALLGHVDCAVSKVESARMIGWNEYVVMRISCYVVGKYTEMNSELFGCNENEGAK
jgi:hypothetical protein